MAEWIKELLVGAFNMIYPAKLHIRWSASGGSARDLRRQQAQGVPKARKKAGFVPTGAVCRSCTILPVSIRAPPPGGETGTVFPDLKYSAPAPCRSGSKGEAPWSPKAKSRIPYFRMPQPNSSGFLARPMPPIHSIQRMRPLPSFSLTRKEKRKRVPVLSGMPSFASGSDTS